MAKSVADKMIVKCGVIGGVIIFLWGMLAWIVFPWQSQVLKKFNNEQMVYDVIKENMTESGVYVLPNMYTYASGMDQQQLNKEAVDQNKMMLAGPVMFAAVTQEGVSDKMTIGSFIVYLIIQIVGVTAAVWLLSKTMIRGFKHQVLFFTCFGALIGLLGILPLWTWWGFSIAYVFTCWIQLVIGWCLAGLAIAKLK